MPADFWPKRQYDIGVFDPELLGFTCRSPIDQTPLNQVGKAIEFDSKLVEQLLHDGVVDASTNRFAIGSFNAHFFQ